MKKERIIFGVIIALAAGICANAESCNSVGSTEVKYTATEPCGYTTQTRTCCATTGAWSEWGGSCPSCSSSQCWNGSKCEDKESVSRDCSGNVTNATGGTQTRTATCTSGSGWSYGLWSGTCTCAIGYKWNGNRCIKSLTPGATYSWAGSVYGGPACNNSNYCVSSFSRCPECNSDREGHVCAVEENCSNSEDLSMPTCSYYYYTCYKGGASLDGPGLATP